MNERDGLLELLRTEYIHIKTEQDHRIGFRDNIIFVQLAAIGSVGSWVLTNWEKPHAPEALLVIPWVCVVLGWTYVVNDHAISRIGKYIRDVVSRRAETWEKALPITIAESNGGQFEIADTFGWEPFHRADLRRKSRKIVQCLIDELTFVVPGVAAIIAYCCLSKIQPFNLPSLLLLAFEVVAMVVLGWTIWSYSDFQREEVILQSDQRENP